MVTRYWRIVFAVLGLTLIGAGEPPKPLSNVDSTEEQRKISASLKSTAASIGRVENAVKPTNPCDPDKPDRNSNLCAQWKAVDAAVDTANASWSQFRLGVAGLLVGLFTLIAAAAAAYFAKNAAHESKRSADTARDALVHDRDARKAELQPYVFVERIELTRSMTNPHVASINVILKNYGLTPALYVKPTIGWEKLPYPLSKKPVHFGMDAEPVSEIAPQQEMAVPFPLPESVIGANVLMGPTGGEALVVHVSANYENRLDLKCVSWSGFYIFDGPDHGFRRLAMFNDDRLGGFGSA